MDAAKIMSGIREIDGFHVQSAFLRNRHPLAHLMAALAFITVVLTVGKYDMSGLIGFLLYPVIITAMSGIPFKLIGKRVLFVLPFICLIGIFNPILDKNSMLIGGFYVSAGWASFTAILIKCVLTVSAALILVCLTGISGICHALRTLRVPKIITAQLAFTYRYIFILCEEVIYILTAYRLRAPHQKGIAIKNFGSLCGGLLLRSLNRANQIYEAMRCRGFDGDMPQAASPRFNITDGLYIIILLAVFILLRVYNTPVFIGNLIEGIY